MNDLNYIKGVVFDWAGTLIDYGCKAPTAVFIEIFKQYGIEITMAEARGPMGLAKKDHIKEILNKNNITAQWINKYNNPPCDEDVDRLYEKLTPALINIIPQFVNIIPGVKEVMGTLREANIKIGSTTGYVTEMMEPVINLVRSEGILPDAIVASDMVIEGRPAPFMIFKNAELLNVFPLCNVVKVGDTVADVKEGLNAGMWVVGYSKCGNEVGLSQDEMELLSKEEVDLKVIQAKYKLMKAGAHFVVEGPWELISVLKKINQLIENGELPIN